MKTSRRRFAQMAAAAALPLVAQAQTTTPPVGTDPPQQQSPPQEEIKPLAKALTSVVAAQYGQFLSAEEMAVVEKDFNDSLTGLQRMRDVKLANSDEPDFSFSVKVQR